MAEYHVWHSGSNTAPYDTWAKAATTLAVVDGVAAAGETIWVASDHVESSAGVTLSFTNASGASSRIFVIGGTRDTTSGITALATGASITSTTTTFTVALNAYFYGITFIQSSASSTRMRMSNTSASCVEFDTCSFQCAGSFSTTAISFGGDVAAGSAYTQTTLRNCTFKFAAVGQQILINGKVSIYGGSIVSGGSTPTVLFGLADELQGGILECAGFDFSNLGVNFDLVEAIGTTQFARIRNCKMPASWAGDLATTAFSTGGTRAELLNYGSGDTNYKFWTLDSRGSCKDETSIYRTAGAMDEATPYSIRMATTTAINYPGATLRSPPIIIRNEVVGDTITAKVHIAHDGASALTDKEIWIELEYHGTAGYPLASFITDMKSILTGATGSGAAQTSSGEAWTGDTGTGPNGSSTWQQLQLSTGSIQTEEVGYLIATVVMAVASTTVFVDPKLEIT